MSEAKAETPTTGEKAPEIKPMEAKAAPAIEAKPAVPIPKAPEAKEIGRAHV